MVPVSLPMRCRRVPAPFSYKNERRRSLLGLRNLNVLPTAYPLVRSAIEHGMDQSSIEAADYVLGRSHPRTAGDSGTLLLDDYLTTQLFTVMPVPQLEVHEVLARPIGLLG